MYSTVQYSSATVLLCYRKVLYSTIHGPAEKYFRIEKILKYTKKNTQVKGKYLVINVVMTLVMTKVKVMTSTSRKKVK